MIVSTHLTVFARLDFFRVDAGGGFHRSSVSNNENKSSRAADTIAKDVVAEHVSATGRGGGTVGEAGNVRVGDFEGM